MQPQLEFNHNHHLNGSRRDCFKDEYEESYGFKSQFAEEDSRPSKVRGKHYNPSSKNNAHVELKKSCSKVTRMSLSPNEASNLFPTSEDDNVPKRRLSRQGSQKKGRASGRYSTSFVATGDNITNFEGHKLQEFHEKRKEKFPEHQGRVKEESREVLQRRPCLANEQASHDKSLREILSQDTSRAYEDDNDSLVVCGERVVSKNPPSRKLPSRYSGSMRSFTSSSSSSSSPHDESARSFPVTSDEFSDIRSSSRLKSKRLARTSSKTCTRSDKSEKDHKAKKLASNKSTDELTAGNNETNVQNIRPNSLQKGLSAFCLGIKELAALEDSQYARDELDSRLVKSDHIPRSKHRGPRKQLSSKSHSVRR